MGRTRLVAKATVSQLEASRASAQKRRAELVNYAIKLKDKYDQKLISYARYVEILHKRTDGKTIKEWVAYYDKYISQYEKLIALQKKNSLKRRIPTILIALVFAYLLFASAIYLRPTIVGFFTQQQEFTEVLDLSFNESGTYEWQIQTPGQLESVKLSGSLKNTGQVQVYLDDLLILDSKNIKSNSQSSSPLTGQTVTQIENLENDIPLWKKIIGFLILAGRVVEEPPTPETSSSEETTGGESAPTEDSSPSQESSPPPSEPEPSSSSEPEPSPPSETSSSSSETINEEVLPTEDSSPSQEEPLPSEPEPSSSSEPEPSPNVTEPPIEPPTNVTEPPTNVTEPPVNITELPTNVTEPEPEEPKTTTFTDICEETCDLTGLNLNKTSYTLRIEITNSEISINSIKYMISTEEEILLEVPISNLTKSQRMSEILARKQFKIDPKILEELLINDKVRIIIKTKPGKKSIGKALGKVKNREFLMLDEFNLDLLENINVEEIVLDQPIELLLDESEQIIRSIDSRNTFGLDGSGKRICIIDTGVDYTHPDITNYVLGFDFINDDADPMDDHGHGTSVSGIISKISPGSELLVAKVIDDTGIGYESDVLQGLQWCMDQASDVISFSIGSGNYAGFCDSNVVAELANEAISQGIFVTAATGNTPGTLIKAPSCATNVTRVSSTTKQDSITSSASVNLLTDLFAPGENVNVPTLGGGSTIKSGTSISTPMVAAGAALVLQNEPTLNPGTLKYRFRSTGEIIPYTQETPEINISRINIYNAIINNITMVPYNYSAEQVETQNETYETLASSIAAYNFSDTTNNKGFVGRDSTSPPAGAWTVGPTEFTTTEYENVNVSDGSYAIIGAPRNWGIHQAEFKINEATDDINSMTFIWQGYNSRGDESAALNDLELYLWNWTSSSWGSNMNTSCLNNACNSAALNKTLTFVVSTSITDYINGSGYVRFIAMDYTGLGFLCPFLYSWNGSEYVFDTTIIYDIRGKENETLQIRELTEAKVKGSSFKFIIKEEEPEESFMDMIYLIINDTNEKGEKVSYEIFPTILENASQDYDLSLLLESDDNYLITNYGDSYELIFENIPELKPGFTRNVSVAAEGYYDVYSSKQALDLGLNDWAEFLKVGHATLYTDRMQLEVNYTSGDAAPSVTLSSPADNTVSSNTTYDFKCNVTESNITNTTIYVWYENNTIFNTTTNTSVGSNLNYTFSISGLPLNESYTWNCLAYDNASQSDWANNWSLNVSVAPNVNLLYPLDSFSSTNYLNDFSCNVTDARGIANVTFWANWSKVWHLVQTNTSGLNYADYNFTLDIRDDYVNQTDGWDISLAGSSNGNGLTTNGSDFWFTDYVDDFVYHFNSSGDNQTDGFNIGNAGAEEIYGITTNGSDFWIVDNSDSFVYHFNSSGDNQTDGFSLSIAGLTSPISITTNGSDFWIVDITDKFVYHFDASGNNITDGFKTKKWGGFSSPKGITGNGSDFWYFDSPAFIYHVNASGDDQSGGFNLGDAGAVGTIGVVSNKELNFGIPTNFWILDYDDNFIYHFESSEEGSYLWGCQACNVWGQCNTSVANRTIIINKTDDFAPPVVTLTSPADGANVSTRINTFSCNVNDNVDVSNVTFWANWSTGWYQVAINTSGTNNVNYNFTSSAPYKNQSDGIYVGSAGTEDLFGIAKDARGFWIPDKTDDFVYHFDKLGNNISGGFSVLAAGASSLLSITTNGSDFWGTDFTDNFVYHFNSTGGNMSDGFNIAVAGVALARGITTNGSDFWIPDWGDNFVYHFNSSGDNQTDGWSLTPSGASNPRGITTNGSDFWVTDNGIDFVFHYDASGNNISDGFDVTGYGNANPLGIVMGYEPYTGTGIDLWIVDNSDDFIYHYSPDGTYEWHCEACDSTGNCNTAVPNNTITIDVTIPKVALTAINATSINKNEYVCVNASVSDIGIGIDSVWVQVTNTTGNLVNYTMNDTGVGCSGSLGDGLYGVEIQLTSGGNYTINTTYANDSLNNIGQDAFVNLQVESIAPSCTSLTSDTTLTANSILCYTLDSDNIFLDCDGYQINGDGDGNDTIYRISATNRVNVTIKNCLIQNDSHGIKFDGVNNSFITNTTFFNITDRSGGDVEAIGIMINNSHDNILESVDMNIIHANSTLTASCSATLYGIYVNGRNNTLKNLTINDASGEDCESGGTAFGTAFFADSANNLTLLNSTIRNGIEGIKISNSESIRIINNTIRNFSTVGIFVSLDSNYSFIKGNKIGNSTRGLRISSQSHDSTIMENVLVNNTNQISIASSYKVNFTNNYISYGQSGIQISGAIGGFIEDNIIKHINGGPGIYVTNTNLNINLIDNNTLYNITTTGLDAAIRINIQTNISNNNITNATQGYSFGPASDKSTVTGGSIEDVINSTVIHSGANNITFFNVTFDKDTLQFEGTGNKFFNYYYLNVNVTNSSLYGISGAEVNTTDNFGFMDNTTTGANGITPTFTLLEFNETPSGRVYSTLYNITANSPGLTQGYVSLNLTNSSTIIITLQGPVPSINLLSPVNDYNTTSFTNTFIAKVSDTDGIANVSLWANWSNGWHQVAINNSGINNVNYSFTLDIRNDYQNQSDGFGFLETAITRPGGVTTNGSDYWVLNRGVDSADPNKFVYHLNSSGKNITNGFSTFVAGASFPIDLTTDGSFFWITDLEDAFMYVFNSSGDNQTGEETPCEGDCPENYIGFPLSNIGIGNPKAVVIEIENHFFWIVDGTDNFVYHVTSGGANLTDGFSLAGTGISDPVGITTNGGDFWILDSTDYFMYHLDPSGNNLTDGFPSPSGISAPKGILSDKELSPGFIHNFWIVDDNNDFINHLASTDEGTYLWSFQACDTIGNCNTSVINRTININLTDVIAPNVSLVYPQDSFNTPNFVNYFVANISDNTDIVNVTLWANWSNGWHQVAINTSGLNNLNYTFSLDIRKDYVNQTDNFDIGGAGAQYAYSIAFNGSDFWAVDYTDDFVYHFNASGDNQTDSFSVGTAGANEPLGITTNGSDFWVVDETDRFMYHFNASGDNQTDGFDVSAAGITEPRDIVTNGSDFWVVDNQDKFVYHFDASGNNLTDGFSTLVSGATNPRGITTNGSDFWVVDANKKVYHFNSSGDNQTDTFNLVAGHDGPYGLVSDKELNSGFINNFWIADPTNRLIYHYASTGEGNYAWGFQACDSVGNCNITSNRTIQIVSATPTIPYIDTLGEINLVEGGYKLISFTFTADDTDGVDDLNDNSVTANFSKVSEETRINSSCETISGENTTTSQNYSCTIKMWYWDASGPWNISVYAEDASGKSASNTTTNFTVSLLKAMTLYPPEVTFSSITQGAVNVSLISNHTVNNTGNTNISQNLIVVGTDLYSGTNRLGVANFTAHGVPPPSQPVPFDCGTITGGVGLQNDTNVTLTNSVLEKGNGTTEQIFYCIEVVPNIPSGVYDTQTSGSWTIRILLVAFSYRRTRRKRNSKKGLIRTLNLLSEELQESPSIELNNVIKLLTTHTKKTYNLTNKEVSELIDVKKEFNIPTSIFSTKLGALEAITKYLRENLGMSYVEISRLLNRNESTIWTAYNKSIEKMKSRFVIEEKELQVPMKIFNNKKLTILETLIAYLRNKEMTYIEISKLLNRDQRNVWSIHSRTLKNPKADIEILIDVTIGNYKNKSSKKLLMKALDVLTNELEENYSLELKEIVTLLSKEVKTKYKLTSQEVSELIDIKKEFGIPTSIFSARLGALEAITKYLKENLGMSYVEISRLLNRNESTIWTAYNKSIEKMKSRFVIEEKDTTLPIGIFENKSLTILEALIAYLRNKEMRYIEISKLLNREQRNIRDTYIRSLKHKNL